MVGSFAQSVKEIPPELLDALSEVEKEQLTNFLWHRWRRQNVQVLEQRLAKLPVYLRQMAEAVNDGYEVPAPEEIWVALNALS
jgi:hypothetical protein